MVSFMANSLAALRHFLRRTTDLAHYIAGNLGYLQFGSKVSGHKQIGGRLHRGLDNASFSTPGGEATATVDFVSPLGADEDPEAGG